MKITNKKIIGIGQQVFAGPAIPITYERKEPIKPMSKHQLHKAGRCVIACPYCERMYK